MDGKRPVIDQMIFDGTLRDKPRGVIEAEIYQSDWEVTQRIFSSGTAPGGVNVGA